MSSGGIPISTTTAVSNDNVIPCSPTHHDMSGLREEYCKIMKSINLLKDEDIVCVTGGQIADRLAEVPNSRLANYLSAILLSVQTLYLSDTVTCKLGKCEQYEEAEQQGIKAEPIEVDVPCDRCENYLPNTSNMSPRSAASFEEYADLNVQNVLCEDCDFSAPNMVELEIHVQEFHLVLLSCEKCQFIATKRQSLDIHEAVVHATLNKYRRKDCLFCCTICSYRTRITTNFNFHIYVHTKDKPYRCKYSKQCSAAFTTSHGLAHHVNSQHRNIVTDKPKFTNRTSSRTTNKPKVHHAGSIRGRPAIKSAKGKLGLEYTNRLHADPMLLKCGMCTFVATKPGSIILHEQLHRTDGKWITCTECDYKTQFCGNFNSHVLTHYQDKPFSCVLCDRAYTCRSNLHVHVRRHHS